MSDEEAEIHLLLAEAAQGTSRVSKQQTMNCQKWKEIRSDIEYALHGTGKQEQRSPSSLWSHEPYPMNIACRSEAVALRSTAQPALLQIPGAARSFKYQDRRVSSDSNRRGCQLSITKQSAHAPVSPVRGFRMGWVPRTRCSMSITRTSPPTRMRSCLTCWAGDGPGRSFTTCCRPARDFKLTPYGTITGSGALRSHTGNVARTRTGLR